MVGNWIVLGMYGKLLEEVMLCDIMLYVSDCDVFIFLVDENILISIFKLGGGIEDLFRGFMVFNSEVGVFLFKFLMFLYCMVCCNCMVMGVRDICEILLRYISGVLE